MTCNHTPVRNLQPALQRGCILPSTASSKQAGASTGADQIYHKRAPECPVLQLPVQVSKAQAERVNTLTALSWLCVNSMNSIPRCDDSGGQRPRVDACSTHLGGGTFPQYVFSGSRRWCDLIKQSCPQPWSWDQQCLFALCRKRQSITQRVRVFPMNKGNLNEGTPEHSWAASPLMPAS